MGTCRSETGNIFSINNLKKGKPLIIDCWATWCGPCVYQVPFMKEFENKYGDKIDFVYLSFDRDKTQWLQKQISLGIEKKTYFLEQDFKSPFAQHFNITSIPRYLEGKLVSDNAPRPSKKEELRQMLDNLIKD